VVVANPARVFAPKPAGLNHVEAASMPLAAITRPAGVCRPGRSPASGSIQSAAGGALRRESGLVLILGADEVIDYRTHDFVAEGAAWTWSSIRSVGRNGGFKESSC
jgi:NADPH:quinone reductase-like Zn-dependent oxidoreductase